MCETLADKRYKRAQVAAGIGMMFTIAAILLLLYSNYALACQLHASGQDNGVQAQRILSLEKARGSMR